MLALEDDVGDRHEWRDCGAALLLSISLKVEQRPGVEHREIFSVP